MNIPTLEAKCLYCGFYWNYYEHKTEEGYYLCPKCKQVTVKPLFRRHYYKYG